MTHPRNLPGAVRIHRPPACEPPYDDERPADWPAPDPWQPTLDFSAATRPDRPRTPPPGRGGGPLLSAPATAPVGADTRAAVRRFLTICLEVLNGHRPAHHLRALSDPLAAADVIEAGREATRRLRREAGPVRVGIRKVRVCVPRPDAVELAAVVAVTGPTGSVATSAPPRPGSPRPDRPGATGRGPVTRHSAPVAGPPPAAGRAWALACRLERRAGRWRCATLRLL